MFQVSDSIVNLTRQRVMPYHSCVMKPKLQQYHTIQLGGGGVQGQGKGQRLTNIFAFNDYIWLATCQSKIFEK